MAIATVEDVARALEIGAPSGRTGKPLRLALAAAIESVQEYTKPRTWDVLTESTVPSSRTYLGGTGRVLIADVEAQDVTVEESADLATWVEASSTTWHLEPFNEAAAHHLVRHGGEFAAYVRVTGRHGVVEVPSAVTEATVIWASRLYERRNSPTGVTYGGDFGPIRISRFRDPDVAQLLDTVAPPLIA